MQVQKLLFVWFIIFSISLWFVFFLIVFFNFLRINYIDAVTDVFNLLLPVAIIYVFSIKTYKLVINMHYKKLQNLSLVFGYIHLLSNINNSINVEWLKK